MATNICELKAKMKNVLNLGVWSKRVVTLAFVYFIFASFFAGSSAERPLIRKFL